jgi:hypothetical protein
MRIYLLFIVFVFEVYFGVDIPTTAIKVGDGGVDENGCGKNGKMCLTLSYGYNESNNNDGSDRHVEISGGLTISSEIKLENGGIFYTYGSKSSSSSSTPTTNLIKITCNNNFYIESLSNTSWYIYLFISLFYLFIFI